MTPEPISPARFIGLTVLLTALILPGCSSKPAESTPTTVSPATVNDSTVIGTITDSVGTAQTIEDIPSQLKQATKGRGISWRVYRMCILSIKRADGSDYCYWRADAEDARGYEWRESSQNSPEDAARLLLKALSGAPKDYAHDTWLDKELWSSEK